MPSVTCPGQPDRLALDRDAALALDVHAVEVLRAHLPRVDDAGELQHAVGQRRLAVVDVGDDAEVADRRPGRCLLARGPPGGVAGTRDKTSRSAVRRAAPWSHVGSRLAATSSAAATLTAVVAAVQFQWNPGVPVSLLGFRPYSDTFEAITRGEHQVPDQAQPDNEKAGCATRPVKSSLKTAVRKFREAAEAGDAEKAHRAAARRQPQAGQGRQQGRHPQEPGREPQVGAGQARCRALVPPFARPRVARPVSLLLVPTRRPDRQPAP